MKARFRGATYVAVIGLLSIALLAAACGDDDSGSDDSAPTATTDAATQAPTAAPTEAATEAPSATPIEAPVEAPVGHYPAEVVDLLGRTVTIEARPEAVIAISPSAVEFVYAAGATVIGRTSSTLFPPAALEAEDIGTAYQPNFDLILTLSPDLIVADASIHSQPQTREALENFGVPVVFAGATSVDDVYVSLNLMGEVFDAFDETDAVTADIQTAFDDAKSELDGTDATFLALIADREQNLFAAKESGFTGDIFAQLGIENPAADQPDAGSFPGYTLLAMELILQFDTDFLFTITPAPEPAPRLSDLILQIPPFAGLQAVRNGNVVELDVQIFLQAPGPRIGEAFTAVADAMAAE